MKKIKFPIVGEGQAYFPQGNTCPMCGKDILGNFIELQGGALLKTGKNTASCSDRLTGHLCMIAHYDDDDIYKHVDIAEDTKDGQFDIHTCSIECMKKLLCKALDKLQVKMDK